MKRLSLATELLAPVSLIVCDEPTSGLDSFFAENVDYLKFLFCYSKSALFITFYFVFFTIRLFKF